MGETEAKLAASEDRVGKQKSVQRHGSIQDKSLPPPKPLVLIQPVYALALHRKSPEFPSRLPEIRRKTRIQKCGKAVE